jgi:hypothetical protein
MRIQIEFPQSKVADLNWLKEKGGVKTYYDLFNNALSILKWATQEVIGGNEIVTKCEDTGKTRYLVMPFLQEAAKHAEPNKSTRKPVPAESSKPKTRGGAAAG